MMFKAQYVSMSDVTINNIYDETKTEKPRPCSCQVLGVKIMGCPTGQTQILPKRSLMTYGRCLSEEQSQGS